MEEILFFCGQHLWLITSQFCGDLLINDLPHDTATDYRDMMLMFIGLFTFLVGGKDTNYTLTMPLSESGAWLYPIFVGSFHQ